MGLDIYTLPRAKWVALRDDPSRTGAETDALFDEYRLAYNSACFRDRLDGWDEGFYAGESVSGPSFNYLGYGEFRGLIAEHLMGAAPERVWKTPEVWASHPLLPLVNFSDCEGTIGPVTAKRIAAGLTEGEARFTEAVAAEPDAEWVLRSYTRLREAFPLAADTEGLVLYR